MKESIFNERIKHNERLFIYNTNNGGLIELEDRPLSHEEEEYLFKNGFFVSNEIDEVDELEKEINKNIREGNDVLDLTIELTNKCNFQCVYCYQDKNDTIMDESTANELISKVEELVSDGLIKGLNIHYFGGEPLLNTRILMMFDRRFKEMRDRIGIEYTSYITTNGALLSTELLKNVNFNYIQLTFDGDESMHNKLRRSTTFQFNDEIGLIDRIMAMTESFIIVRMNVCDENKDDVIPFYRMILSIYGTERIVPNMNRMIKFHKSDPFTMLTTRDYAKIEMELRILMEEFVGEFGLPTPPATPCKFMCEHAYAISPVGKCDYCSGSTGNGCVLFSRINHRKKRPHHFREECKTCKCLPICLGGCEVHKRVGAGSCIMEKYYLKDIIQHYIQLYLEDER